MQKTRLWLLFRQRLFVVFLLLLQIGFIAYQVFSGSQYFRILDGFFRAVSIIVALHMIAKKDKGAYKLTWVFHILIFPIFGGLFYVLFHLQSARKKYDSRIERIERKTRPLFLLPGDCYESAVSQAPEHIHQIRYLQHFAGFPVYTNTETKYLSPGEMNFENLVLELRKAEKYIFLEYFIVREGKMWNTVLEILKEKVRQGVEVRMMYDDIGCILALPKDYPRQLAHFGIKCAVFSPFRPVLTVTQNNRDHRKIAVIDGKVAFTGGVNLADEYINAYERFGHWKDASVMVKGEAAWSFTLMYLQMWAYCKKTEENYMHYYPWKDETCPILPDGFVQPYADNPSDNENVGEHVYLQMMSNAKKYVYINTPYLIIDESMVSALTLAAKSGTDVRIVTPHKWDKRIVHMTTRSYYRELIEAGIKIYEYTDGFIHSKTFVSDDEVATVGTTNLDFRSLYLHYECGVWLYKSTAVMEVKKDFLKTLELCQEITKDECKGNIISRFIQDILRLYAPLM